MQTTDVLPNSIDLPQYPIGTFTKPEAFSESDLAGWIRDIEEGPEKLRGLLAGLNEDQLQTPYRDGSWTIRQLVHHLSDSHMNGYIRLKLALTEEGPTIRPYFQERWAELADGKHPDLQTSLRLLEAVHIKWVRLLRSLENEQFDRTMYHPEWQMELSVADLTADYSWHTRHHLKQIENLKAKMGW